MSTFDQQHNPGQKGLHGRLGRISRRPCIGYRKLMIWEMDQYHQAVDDLQKLLSEKQGTTICWSAAEETFCEEQCEKLSLEWRRAYCGEICEHRVDCPLADLYHSAA